jgi:hypothetical protein
MLSPLLHCAIAEGHCKTLEDLNLKYYSCDNMKSHIYYIIPSVLSQYVSLGVTCMFWAEAHV